MSLLLTTLQAENTVPLMAGLAGYLSRRLGKPRLQLPVTLEAAEPWQARARRLYAGEIQVGMICARPYGEQAAAIGRTVTGLAAPVYQGTLYGGRPVYYSYLVVHRRHPATSLRDLAGGRTAYNEPGSQSGYFSLLWALAGIGEGRGFFAEWIEAGAHVRSLALLQARRADTAAIDATLWDYLAEREPARLADLHVIATVGPFPAPPIVGHVSLPGALREQLTDALIGMHRERAGRAVLATGRVERFLPVVDEDYLALVGSGGDGRARGAPGAV